MTFNMHGQYVDPDQVIHVDTGGVCTRADDPEAGSCGGAVEERYSRSGMTASMRCERHEQQHQEVLDGIANRYPDTDSPPSWFDPTYAGESWDGES